jgi:hypothetical protein
MIFLSFSACQLSLPHYVPMYIHKFDDFLSFSACQLHFRGISPIVFQAVGEAVGSAGRDFKVNNFIILSPGTGLPDGVFSNQKSQFG